MFRAEKNNLPKNYSVPQDLKTFLGAIKSEILDQSNRNYVPCNIPEDEIVALKELIRLQRDWIITIKPCDKGAGVIIIDFNEYLRASYMPISSKQKQPDGTFKYRYELVDVLKKEKAKTQIKKQIDEGLNNDIITQEEYNALDSEDKDVARFYCNFKVHNNYEPKLAPPPRAIISGSGSITENASLFVQHHIKDINNPSLIYSG